MSKHLGNMLEPMPLMEAHGADAVRWFFAASGSPWGARRVGHDALDEIVTEGAAHLLEHGLVPGPVRERGRLDGRGPRLGAPPARTGRCSTGGCSASCTRWCGTSRLRWRPSTRRPAGRRLAAFIDDLSNWYVRRSRRRFWDGPAPPAARRRSPRCTSALTTLTLLMAPFMPFVTDYVWGVLRARRRRRTSVHLAAWPAIDPVS